MRKETNKREATLIYAGIYIGTEKGKDKKYHMYFEVINDKPDEDKVSLYGKRLYPCSVGSYFTIQVHDGGCNTGTVKFIDMWQDFEYVNKIRATSEAVDSAYIDKNKKHKKENQNPMLDTLKPFREAYKELDWRGRRALIANIIGYIACEQ